MKTELNNVIEFEGFKIKHGENMVSLTDLWKASGKGLEYKPKFWMYKTESAEFILAVMKEKKFKGSAAEPLESKPYGYENRHQLEKWCRNISREAEKQGLINITKGRYGGTFAHPQIALAYAKYLSPKLHIFVNQVFFERLEEQHNPELSIARGRARAIETWHKQGKSDTWIQHRLNSIKATKLDNGILKDRLDNRVGFAKCADAVTEEVTGMTAKQFKVTNGLPNYTSVPEMLEDEPLLQYQLARMVSAKFILRNDIQGNKECAKVHKEITNRIVKACN